MLRKLIALAAVLLVHLPAEADENAARGREEFMVRCAVCHGLDATGGGPLAEMLAIEPANLTALSAGNGGEFPFERIYQVIDGRAQVRGHGTSDMPIWGDEYNEEALEYYRRRLEPLQAENYVTRRILSLIRYLQSIQGSG